MTDEQIEKVAYLNRAFYADNKIKALEEVLKKNRSIAERCTASYENSGGSSGSHDNSQEKIIHQLCDDNFKIQEELKELMKIRKEIKKAILTLKNDELETILNMRYLAYKNMTQIAESMNYDRKTIQRKHKIALDKLSLNVAPES